MEQRLRIARRDVERATPRGLRCRIVVAAKRLAQDVQRCDRARVAGKHIAAGGCRPGAVTARELDVGARQQKVDSARRAGERAVDQRTRDVYTVSCERLARVLQ